MFIMFMTKCNVSFVATCDVFHRPRLGHGIFHTARKRKTINQPKCIQIASHTKQVSNLPVNIQMLQNNINQ